ncbi:nuclear transport factor 2 family protein [Catenovulum agarivorans]|uniref:nuclear transport factor 2 family protein n=1 Tax=Catenovulum agarivorans TaxID=1172192 RepID=UPI0003010436|nr:nuclear transport factor 2 family protein [Catenovulum agarivorans]
MLLFIHIVSAAIWLGTAITLPFWGNRANRADHLHTVLGIIDTVFILKCVFIMGGLFITLLTGWLLATEYQLITNIPPTWLSAALAVSLIIALNSCIIFYFLWIGRKGKRSLMRLVPPVGYSNIALIILVYFLMIYKPVEQTAFTTVTWVIALVLLANAINITVKLTKLNKLKNMSPSEYADNYFALLNAEKMTDLLKLFKDDAMFIDPFATGPIQGILAIEQFFQKLGDQFDSIKMHPEKVVGSNKQFTIHWVAQGVTQNGEQMPALRGTNLMTRLNGKISTVLIDFDLTQLPQVQLVNADVCHKLAAA